MADKQLSFEEEARVSLLSGVEQLRRVVGLTLGPSGRNVMLSRMFGNPVVCSDGVTIAKEVELPDPYENLGAQLVKEAASKTNDAVGDGTTTSVVLADAMVHGGFKNVAAGANGMSLRTGIETAVDAVVAELREMAIPVEGREQVARVAALSAHEEAIAEQLANALEKVGRDGVVTIEESKSLSDELDFVEGVRIDRGYLSPHFVTDTQRMEVAIDRPYFLLTDQKVSSPSDLIGILEKMVGAGQRTLVLIAEDVEGEALSTLVVNKTRGILECIAIKAPGFGERRKALLEDMAIVTGGTVISADRGLRLDAAELEHLGTARRLVANKDESTIIEGHGSEQGVKDRLDQLRGADRGDHLGLRPGKAARTDGGPGGRRGRREGRGRHGAGGQRAQVPHRGRAFGHSRGHRGRHRTRRRRCADSRRPRAGRGRCIAGGRRGAGSAAGARRAARAADADRRERGLRGAGRGGECPFRRG